MRSSSSVTSVHGDAGDGAEIEGLAAGGGIEGGAVQVDG